VQFSSEGTRDPDGDPITYEWDFGDGTPGSTELHPSHTYTAVGTYRATLTVTDDTGRSGTDDVTVVVGNAAPAVEISSPLEGGFFDFGDAIPFEITVTDTEDGSVAGDHAACARMRVQYLLGHDEHSHPLTEATGCRGTIQTSGAAGHGEDANIFGLISATYTDGGGLPGAPALNGQDGLQIWPRLLQAEHFTEMRGVIIYPIAGAGGGEQVGSTEDDGTEGGVNYIAWEPVDLTGIASITVTAAAGGDGGPIEVRLDDPVSGPLLGTIDVPNTGGWETRQDFTLPIQPPSGAHKLVFAFPTGGMDVDQIKFNEG
jgi:PKD repeat protein